MLRSEDDGERGEHCGDVVLNALFERVFAGDMAIDPQQATALGVDKGPLAGARSRLNDGGRALDQERFAHARAMLGELRALDPAGLSETAGCVARSWSTCSSSAWSPSASAFRRWATPTASAK